MKSKKIRIPIKFKIFGLVAFLVFFALVMILFQTSKIFRSDKEDFVKEMNAKLASSSSKSLADRVANIQDKLVVFISSKESLARTKARLSDQNLVLFARYQDFNSIALAKTEGASETLKLEWVLRNPNGEAEKWTPELEKDFLKNLSMKSAQGLKRWFWKMPTADGRWQSVLGFGVDVVDKKEAGKKKKDEAAETITTTYWIFGFMPSTVLEESLRDFSTGISTAYVVDEEGIVIVSSDSKLKSRNLMGFPLVSEAVKKKRPAGTGDYIDPDNRGVVGSFENITKINLSLIVTTPKDKAFEAASVLERNIVYIGLVILIAAIGTAIILSNIITKPLQNLAGIAAKIGAGDFTVPVDVKTNDEIGDLADSFSFMEKGLQERDEALEHSKSALVQSEKMSAFGQLSAGIAHEVKNPLAGILGHAQLAMGKLKDDDIKKHLEVIEKETRRCKAIVENLMKFARAEKIQLEPTNLAQVVQDTINLVEHQLTLAGCKIFKDFQPCPMVSANGNQLQQVLLNLMVNASHAMENCAKKNVIVRTLQVGEKAQIQIEDTGTGIPPEVQKKIFEPFFTTKPAGKGTGLGLSVSIGIVKDHKGEIYLKSEMNQGTTFFIDFPIPEGAKLPTKPLENTHGGAYLTADAKALAESKVHEQKISSAQEQKPAELHTQISAKQIDRALDDFDARKVAATKPDAAAKTAEIKKVEIKPAETKIEAKVEVKAEAAAAPKPTTPLPGAPKLPSLDGVVSKTKKSELPGLPSKLSTETSKIILPVIPKTEVSKEVPLPTLPNAEKQTAKIDIPLPEVPAMSVAAQATTAVSLPTAKTAATPEASSVPQTPTTSSKEKEVTPPQVSLPKVSLQQPEIRTVEIPKVGAIKKASSADVGEFKVKINKPKLKA